MVQYISKSHKDCSLLERETFFSTLNFPNNIPHVKLITCDRIEIYWGDDEVPVEVALHLFRVVSGLESSLIGETAIQGQVKNSYESASEKYSLSSSLHQLFQTALSVGKRVRTESGISQGAISHSQAVIECLINENVALKHALITMLGINKLNEDIIKFLHAKDAMSIFLGNRYFEKAEKLAQQYNCKAFKFDELKSFMNYSDVLITATSAPHCIIRPEHISSEQNILIFDLAFPRDVDPLVANMPNVTLYNLEDIKSKVNQNLEQRKSKLVFALDIIDNELDKFRCKQQRSIEYCKVNQIVGI